MGPRTMLTCCLGQTEPRGNGTTNFDGTGADGDFLTRERAALGEDAAQFSSARDNSATIKDGDDDLLGGGDSYGGGHPGGEETTEFESSFPAVDTQNQVRSDRSVRDGSLIDMYFSKLDLAEQLLAPVFHSSHHSHPTVATQRQKRSQSLFGWFSSYRLSLP